MDAHHRVVRLRVQAGSEIAIVHRNHGDIQLFTELNHDRVDCPILCRPMVSNLDLEVRAEGVAIPRSDALRRLDIIIKNLLRDFTAETRTAHDKTLTMNKQLRFVYAWPGEHAGPDTSIQVSHRRQLDQITISHRVLRQHNQMVPFRLGCRREPL